MTLQKKAKQIVGIEINKNYLQIAKSKYNKDNIKYIQVDITTYNFEENYDVVVISNVLEHIKDRKKFLDRIKKISNKLLIRVPMIDRDWLTLYKKNLGLEYRLDKSHYIEYTLNTFIKELEKSGLKLLNYKINFGEIWAVVSS